MPQAARAFEDNRGGNSIFRSVPHSPSESPVDLPYTKVRQGEMPPMMFQLRLCDGQVCCFAYSDVREIRSRDAGRIEIGLFAMEKTRITIEGRHLRELAGLLSTGMIRWIEEGNERDIDRPEGSPGIVRISIEAIEDSD